MSAALPWWLLLQNFFWAGIAALGFAILFNVPVRTLFACALGGAIAYGIRTLVVQFGPAGIAAATLVGATAVGFLGVVFGRRWRAPAPAHPIRRFPQAPGAGHGPCR